MKFMSHLLITSLVFTFATVSFANNDVQATIVGGVEATPGEFPFIVSLHGTYGGHFCGGSLIKKNWVLTAAHCVKGSTIKNVVIGLHDQKKSAKAEKIAVKRSIVHPEYSQYGGIDYDFALVELAQDSAFAPIALNANEIVISGLEGEEIMTTVAGWGATRESSYSLPNLLQKVSVPLIPMDQCNKSYNNTVTDRMICAGYAAGGKDSCQGDSGGPLVAQDENGHNVLIGVVSWGRGCARPGYPGVYAKVNAVTTWIEQEAR